MKKIDLNKFKPLKDENKKEIKSLLINLKKRLIELANERNLLLKKLSKFNNSHKTKRT